MTWNGELGMRKGECGNVRQRAWGLGHSALGIRYWAISAKLLLRWGTVEGLLKINEHRTFIFQNNPARHQCNL